MAEITNGDFIYKNIFYIYIYFLLFILLYYLNIKIYRNIV